MCSEAELKLRIFIGRAAYLSQLSIHNTYEICDAEMMLDGRLLVVLFSSACEDEE